MSRTLFAIIMNSSIVSAPHPISFYFSSSFLSISNPAIMDVLLCLSIIIMSIFSLPVSMSSPVSIVFISVLSCLFV